MFQAFIDADRNLGREPVPASEYRRTDDGGKPGIDQDLAAHYHETPVKSWIVAGMMNAIDFASPHPLLHRRLLPCNLIPQNVFYLCIQLIRGLIEEFEIASFNLRPRLPTEVLSQHSFDKCRTRLLRSRNPIDAAEHVFR